MKFTKIPDWFRKEFEEKLKNPDMNNIEDDIFRWAYHFLGVKIRIFQAWCIHNILISKTKRVALCWARQLGKSIALGIFCFWATFYNKYPATIESITTCYIMSRDDEVAIELLEKVRGLIFMGDRKVYETFKQRKYFTQHFGKPDNQHQITWKHNRCFIKSIPPTDTAIGKSASIFIVDEIGKLKVQSPYTDKRLYYEVIEPTTSETGGFLIISSTPNGCANVFYDLFDPDEKIANETGMENEFERIWLDHTIRPDPAYQAFVEKKRKQMEATGELKLWQQEYGALFTVTKNSFFEPKDIDEGVDNSLTELYDYKLPCSAGIDYGMNPSRTVITIKALIDGKAVTIKQIRFPGDFDENLLMDSNYENGWINLRKRYKITQIVADDCLEENTEVLMGDYSRKKIKDIKIGDSVLSYNQKYQGFVSRKVYDTANKGKKQAYEIKFKNGTKVMASGSHKWYLHKKNCLRKNELYIKHTKDINIKKDVVPSILKPIRKPQHHNPFNEADMYILGMYIAEGHKLEGHRKYFISQLNKKGLQKLKEKLKQSNVKSFSINSKGYRISDGGKVGYLLDQVHRYSYNKNIPVEVFSYNDNLLNVLFEGLIDGDGCVEKPYKDKRGFKIAGRIGYCTNSKELCLDVMTLARLIGKPMYYRERVHSGFGSKRIIYEPVYSPKSFYCRKTFSSEVSKTSIVSIKKLNKEVNMFDISVEQDHNFILAESGVLTSNCPQGNMMNKWMKSKGWNVKLLNFRTDQAKGGRNRSYYKYRTWLKARKIKYPKLPDLLEEMKILEETKLTINVSIKSPTGKLCDCIDSEMMATIPLLEENSGFSSSTVESLEDNSKPTPQVVSFDNQWNELVARDSWIMDEINKT